MNLALTGFERMNGAVRLFLRATQGSWLALGGKGGVLGSVWRSGFWRIYPFLTLYSIGYATIFPVTPTLVTNGFASIAAGRKIDCQQFTPATAPVECRDAHSTAVMWSSWTSFVEGCILTFVFAPYVGHLSDVYGRKLFMLIGVSLTILPVSMLLAFVCDLVPIYWYYPCSALGSVVSSFSMCLTSVADLVEQRHRAMAVALLTSCFSLGLVVGPQLGGYLTPQAALCVCLGVTAACFVYIIAFIQETAPLVRRRRALAHEATSAAAATTPLLDGGGDSAGHTAHTPGATVQATAAPKAAPAPLTTAAVERIGRGVSLYDTHGHRSLSPSPLPSLHRGRRLSGSGGEAQGAAAPAGATEQWLVGSAEGCEGCEREEAQAEVLGALAADVPPPVALVPELATHVATIGTTGGHTHCLSQPPSPCHAAHGRDVAGDLEAKQQVSHHTVRDVEVASCHSGSKHTHDASAHRPGAAVPDAADCSAGQDSGAGRGGGSAGGTTTSSMLAGWHVIRGSRFYKLLALVWVVLSVSLAGAQGLLMQYLQLTLGFNTKDQAQLLTLLAVSGLVVKLGLLPLLVPRLGEKRVLLIGLSAIALGDMAIAAAPSKALALAAVCLSALSAVNYPAMWALQTSRAAPHQQGAVAGTLQAVSSLASGLGPLAFAALFSAFTRSDSDLPFMPEVVWYAGAGLAVVGVVVAALLPGAGVVGSFKPHQNGSSSGSSREQGGSDAGRGGGAVQSNRKQQQQQEGQSHRSGGGSSGDVEGGMREPLLS